MSLVAELENKFKDQIKIKQNVPAERLTTFALGGGLDLLIEVQYESTLILLLKYFYKNNITYKILGNGSNLLVPDSGINVPVLKLAKALSVCNFESKKDFFINIEKYKFEIGKDYIFNIQGASPLMNLSRQFTQAGFSGLEFAAGIPASLAGAIFMNAGAHGSSISDIVARVYLVTRDGSVLVLNRDEINYEYRKSNLPKNSIVFGCDLRLKFEEKEIINSKRNSCLDYRKNTQPLQLPSAGSVFKNPSPDDLALSRIASVMDVTIDGKVAAAAMLDKLGYRGFRHGGVSFSKMHANWLVKDDSHASAEDVIYLIKHAQENVEKEFGIILKPEIVCW